MDDTSETMVTDDWAKIESLFPAKKALRPSWAWFNGMSTRLKAGRIARLMKDDALGALAAILDQCDDDRVKALRSYAAINLEQVQSAFRFTMVANVSAPIIFLTLLNQFAQGGLGALLYRFHQNEREVVLPILYGGSLAALMLLFVAFYALAHLNRARDIRHLIDLMAAERGIFFGLEDSSDPYG